MIGIDRNTWLIYEGASWYGHGVSPSPVILAATIVDDMNVEPPKAPSLIDQAKHVFREDSFDPVTRVRRGRLYVWPDNAPQPGNWWVHQHPALHEEVGKRDHEGRFAKSLLTYIPMNGFQDRLIKASGLVLMLGGGNAFSLWKPLLVERIASGEELLTLKAYSNLGVVPELILEGIPEQSRSAVSGAVKRVVDCAFTGNPVSVVDQCRDAAQVVLAHWFMPQSGDASILGRELGQIIRGIADYFQGKRAALVDAADLIRLLHPRGKSNEQQKLGLRPPSEEDAQLALQALGFLLRDLGWAR